MAARRKRGGLKVVYRSPSGATVWAIPGSSMSIMWAGPGAGLKIGYPLVAGGHVTGIDHPTADGRYATRAQAAAAAKAFVEAGGRADRRRSRASRYGNVHPEFPRVVVYLFRVDGGGVRVVAKVKDDYHAHWRIVARRGYVTTAEARKGAHEIGGALEKRLKAPKAYELVYGAPPGARW